MASLATFPGTVGPSPGLNKSLESWEPTFSLVGGIRALEFFVQMIAAGFQKMRSLHATQPSLHAAQP
jgi:hypothetical protein